MNSENKDLSTDTNDYSSSIESDSLEEGSKSFRDLIVWQKAHQFVLEVYRISGNFPKEERYGIISQLRRSACSVPANIVEGFNRYSQAEKLAILFSLLTTNY